MDIERTTGTAGRGWVFAAGLLLVSALSAEAAVTPEQKCEGGKIDAAGKFSACLAKAEKGLVSNGDVAKYDAAVTKCQATLDSSYTKLEAAAEKKGGTCPTVNDAAPVEAYVTECVDGLAVAAAGGDLPTCDGGGGGVPQTGQTTAYGAGTDGDLERGTARSFTDNGDGTITDNVTGLMWEKKSNDGSIHDLGDRYTWSTGTGNMDGTIVTTFLAGLNASGGFAGHTDWRIPNIHELQTLVNFEVFSPSAFSEFNNSCTGGCTVATCSCTSSGDYSSSTTRQNFTDDTWDVGFADGDTVGGDKMVLKYVRAVRGGS